MFGFCFMANNLWQNLRDECSREKRPILALAPMAGITDSAFRLICKRFGADVVYSEMASVNALVYKPDKTLEMLAFEELERPYIVQLFGSEPRHFEAAVKLVEERLRPDGIDINFGCPVPKVAKQEAGAELFKNLVRSKEVIKAVIGASSLPVSIKVRKSVGDMDVFRFLDNIADLDIKTVMIHGRDFRQIHSGPVDAEAIKRARNHFGGVILANGGVRDAQSAKDLFEKSGADGLGIAQGALGRPWLFEMLRFKIQDLRFKNNKEIFDIVLEHARLAEKKKGPQGLIEMRKHLCWYALGMPNAARLREKFVRVEKMEEIIDIMNTQ
jgi:tRNA-dihydrouridine synthase B